MLPWNTKLLSPNAVTKQQQSFVYNYVRRNTSPPLSPPPHANSSETHTIIGPAVINRFACGGLPGIEFPLLPGLARSFRVKFMRHPSSRHTPFSHWYPLSPRLLDTHTTPTFELGVGLGYTTRNRDTGTYTACGGAQGLGVWGHYAEPPLLRRSIVHKFMYWNSLAKKGKRTNRLPSPRPSHHCSHLCYIVWELAPWPHCDKSVK